MTRCAGWDVGMTSGFCIFDGTMVNCSAVIKSNPKDGSTEMRAKAILEEVLRYMEIMGAGFIAVENAAYEKKWHQFDYGRLHGVIRLGLEEAGFLTYYVPPSELKLFATGSGKATKEQMITAAKPWLVTKDHNEADALHLSRYMHEVVQQAERDEDGALVLRPLVR